MKKMFFWGSVLFVVLAMTSCKSSESAYKKAYEKAQAAQMNGENARMETIVTTTQQTTPVAVTPVTPTTTVTTSPVTTTPATTTPATTVTTTPVTTVTTTPVTTVTTTPVQTNDYSNVRVIQEAVTLVEGTGLKDYSVVVGSFGLQSNAQSLQSTLAGKGYAAQVVSATVDGNVRYRVVATTHDTKEQAAQSRAALMGDFPDAWLLYKK